MKKRFQFFAILMAALMLSVISTLALPSIALAQATSTTVFFVPASAPRVIPTFAEIMPTARDFLAANPGLKKAVSVGIASRGTEDTKVNSYWGMNRAAQGAFALRNAGFTGEISHEDRVATDDNILQRGIMFVAADGLSESQVNGLIKNAIEALEAKLTEMIAAERKAREEADVAEIAARKEDDEKEAGDRQRADAEINDRIANFGLDIGPEIAGVTFGFGESFNMVGGTLKARFYRLRAVGSLYVGTLTLPDKLWDLGLEIEAPRIDMGDPGRWTSSLLSGVRYVTMSVDIDDKNTAIGSFDGGEVTLAYEFRYTTGGRDFVVTLTPGGRIGYGHIRGLIWDVKDADRPIFIGTFSLTGSF